MISYAIGVFCCLEFDNMFMIDRLLLILFGLIYVYLMVVLWVFCLF